MVAVHGYANDGVSPAHQMRKPGKAMYKWGAAYNLPLWMTETSGYPNTQDGAIALSKAMYIALKYGNVSAWIFWSISTSTLDAYSLMNSAGSKSKRYYAVKKFLQVYQARMQSVLRLTQKDTDKLLPLAFNHSVK